MTSEYIVLAERHVAEVEDRIAHQHTIIETLRQHHADDHVMQHAESTLASLQTSWNFAVKRLDYERYT